MRLIVWDDLKGEYYTGFIQYEYCGEYGKAAVKRASINH